jgi:hypothetical protein
MAEKNDGIGSSRLTEISEQFYKCSIVLNSCRYLPENQYDVAHPDTLSDGDCRGRDPEDAGGSIGTNKDITERTIQLVRNSCLYTTDKPYGEGNC